ncbi:hypothetical protein B0H63DRAFT_552315 [Podospora didyma]|uniref:MYND-type domain-containing protein n=1 Tax=Podospora didyma TaxID=330526 RepID=A0AAE0N5P1_9PEZI|nr:hypothetical protein B0H63DRAFT_552315 [Podospora didyma]
MCNRANPQCTKRCGGCKVAVYCNPAHKRCAREKTEQEETALRASSPDKNVFETSVGMFWAVLEMRPYLSARFHLMMACLDIRTGEAVEAALEHAMDMLWLCGGDNQGVRGYVPGMLLRLGRDQDACDFTKWRATVAWLTEKKHVLDDMSLPTSIELLVPLALMKLRMMRDVWMLQATTEERIAKGKAVPDAWKMRWLKYHALRSVLEERTDTVYQTDYAGTVETLTNQFRTLAILNPHPYANGQLSVYMQGSKEEVVLVMRQSWYSWAETENAVDVVRSWMG